MGGDTLVRPLEVWYHAPPENFCIQRWTLT